MHIFLLQRVLLAGPGHTERQSSVSAGTVLRSLAPPLKAKALEQNLSAPPLAVRWPLSVCLGLSFINWGVIVLVCTSYSVL